jgi:hypothetical protein
VTTVKLALDDPRYSRNAFTPFTIGISLGYIQLNLLKIRDIDTALGMTLINIDTTRKKGD